MKTITLIILLFFLMPAIALAENQLSIDLAYDHVDITTGFTGSSVVVFGTKPERGDLAVVLEGPKKEVIIRKKESVFGAWLNRRWLEYKNIPLYYDYAMEEGGDEARLNDHGIGQAALRFKPDITRYDDEEVKNFHKALIELRQNSGLYATSAKTIKTIKDGLFRINFELPSNVPKGEYTVKAFTVNDSKVLQETEKTFKIAQVGFSFDIFQFAKDSAFLYGVLCVVVAFVAGWVSNKITN